MKSDDIFCKLYDIWKKNGKIIFENDHAYSILSVTPVTPGHAIVITKDHVEQMRELRGSALESFIDAIPSTLVVIRDIYDSDPEQMARFYQSLKESPPTPSSADLATKMLQDRYLKIKPDTAYNVGINVGDNAGQLVNHLHAQLFPRRERGLGIATAMEMLLKD